MKIIYLHQYFKFPTEHGGTRSYDLAKEFALAGHSVSVLTTTPDKNITNGNRWSRVECDGINIHYINIPYNNAMSYPRRIWTFLKFVIFCTFKLLSMRCDVVLATSTPLTIGIPAILKKWLTRTPYIFEVRDVWPEAVIAIGAIKNKLLQKVLFFLEKIIYKNALSIVPLSIDMKESIIQRMPEVESKIHNVIPNIAEINRFQNSVTPVNLEEKLGLQPRFTVLYAGTFGCVNGLHYIVELARLTKKIDPTLCYVLIGDGLLKKDVIRQAEHTKVLNHNLFILDSISKDELPSWYKSVSMGSSFVINIKELWANSANKFFDTLAAGKPILINHKGWQAKTIRDENIGYILPSKITEKSAAYFVTYTLNTELHNKQCKNALNLAKQKFSLEVASNKYLEVLNTINS